MKQLIITAIICLLVACKADEPKAFQIKDTDMISIKPASTAMGSKQAVKSSSHLTALEIVKQTTEISTPAFGRSFIKDQRDTVSATPRLLMWATDVITLDGQLQTDWITATDVVFVRYNLNTPLIRDTIAYIPNSVLRIAGTAIRSAYSAKDIDACYTLFNNAYTFTPITGAEWRQLKAAGQN